MSIADIAAALIGLRETTYKDHQRFAGTLDGVEQAMDQLRETVDQAVDKRLAQSAQAVRDLDRRLETTYERRIDTLLMTLIEVTDRLSELAETADSTDDVAELQERLRSLAGPRERLTRLLEEAGVLRFVSEGEPYDAHRHEVMQREHRPDCLREYVLKELRPGYLRAGTDHTLVRAKVIVAAPPVTEDLPHG